MATLCCLQDVLCTRVAKKEGPGVLAPRDNNGKKAKSFVTLSD